MSILKIPKSIPTSFLFKFYSQEGGNGSPLNNIFSRKNWEMLSYELLKLVLSISLHLKCASMLPFFIRIHFNTIRKWKRKCEELDWKKIRSCRFVSNEKLKLDSVSLKQFCLLKLAFKRHYRLSKRTPQKNSTIILSCNITLISKYSLVVSLNSYGNLIFFN